MRPEALCEDPPLFVRQDGPVFRCRRSGVSLLRSDSSSPAGAGGAPSPPDLPLSMSEGGGSDPWVQGHRATR